MPLQEIIQKKEKCYIQDIHCMIIPNSQKVKAV